MKIGDRVTRTPTTFFEVSSTGKKDKHPVTGTVVYIHPKGRYHTVAFETRGGTILESFKRVCDDGLLGKR